jgi:hypothetical protein
MRSRLPCVFIISIAFVMLAVTAGADVPTLISYQGVLLDSDGHPVITPANVTFTLYDQPSGGTMIWQETQLVEFDEDGCFDVILGETSPVTDDVFDDPIRWLGIQVEGDDELEPRTRIVSVAYANRISTVDGASGGAITGDVSIQSNLSVDGDFSATGKATIGTGHSNTGACAFVAGETNTASGDYSAVSGGQSGTAGGSYSVIGGGQANSTSTSYNTIGGGSGNSVQSEYGTVCGGQNNTVINEGWSAICGGWENSIQRRYSFIGGGSQNYTQWEWSVIGGGWGNTTGGARCTIAGGDHNSASGGIGWATVGGGRYNTASGNYSTVGGGDNNTASADCAVIAGGCNNLAAGDHSMAAGSGAKALHNGSFVWADASNDDFQSTDDNQVMMLASGGTWIYSDPDLLSGVTIHPGASAWATYSDIDLKENLNPVNGSDILRKISSLNISKWNFKAQGDDITHIGPSSQDFYSAFGLGESDKTISTIDADGVALAGIQALLDKIQKLEARIAELEAERK